MSNTQVLLVSRPTELPGADNFKIVKTPIPKVGEGEVLVKVLYISLDPAMRGWMRDIKSYVPPVPLNSVMRAGGVGRVVASKNSAFAVGDLVNGPTGWQEYALVKGKDLQKVPANLPFSPTVWLGALGMTGLTAYFGLLDVGKPKPGDTVLVSGAAGATGSIVGQIAKIKGCHVVGIAGTQQKCDWLVKDLGFDAAVNYKTSKNLYLDIKKACPKGIDVFFDNVGGQTLDIALAQIRFGARVVICGAISQYNAKEGKSVGPANYLSLLVNSARMEGFVVFNYAKRYKEGLEQLAQWALEGKLKWSEHIVDGLENAPSALLKLFDGSNDGKLLIKVSEVDTRSKL